MKLPELPEHDQECYSESGITYYGKAWYEETVKNLLRQAIWDAYEEAAKVCDVTGPDDWTGENCAEAIRKLGESL